MSDVSPKLKNSPGLEAHQVEQTSSHRKLPRERLSPGITQASTGWKELEAQPVVVRSRTGGDVNGACTLYKHPASDRLSHIGSRVSTAEATNNGQTTGSALGNTRRIIYLSVLGPNRSKALQDLTK